MFRPIIFAVLFCGVLSELVTVNSEQGRVQGIVDAVPGYGRVQTFLGIPYAGAPTGEYRLKPPRKASMFSEDPYNATHIRSSCSQDLFWAATYTAEVLAAGFSEDCLFLNVHVPEKRNGTLPVMVWIHGGSFTVGSGSTFDGKRLAMIGQVVIVTLNYRLGLFGFFPNGGTESTLGLQDQIMALQWVQEYIAYFGGDPARVTIFGESAGGASVSFLTNSPRTKGLFTRAICQSGVSLSPWAYVPASKDFETRQIKTMFREYGCVTESLECMKSANVGEIKAIGRSLVVQSPDVDNDVVMADYADMSTVHPGLELMMGVNTDDGAFAAYYSCTDGYTRPCDQYRGLTAKALTDMGMAPQVPDQLDNLIRAYNGWYQYPAEPGRINAKAASQLSTDYMFAIPTNQTATKLYEAGFRVYAYEFNIKGPNTMLPDVPWSTGAQHTDEIGFVFAWETGKESEEELRAALQVSKLWTDFAKGVHNPNWPPFTSQRAEYIVIDRQTPSGRPAQDLIPPWRSGFWNAFFRYGVFPEDVVGGAAAKSSAILLVAMASVCVRALWE